MKHFLKMSNRRVFSLTAARDDPVHLPVQEHSHRGLHQSAEVLTLSRGSDTLELQMHRKNERETVE